MQIQYSCNGQEITASRGGLSASVEAPIQGSYTNARLFNSMVFYACTVAQGKLFALEYKKRV